MYLYNSVSHKKELFVPKNPDLVKMYTCGPTVYHFAHIGNLRTYIMEDILEKYLRYTGYNVKRVMNITDVGHLASDADTGEDKMLKGAKRENKSVMDLFREFYGLQNGGQEPSDKHISVIEEILKEMEALANEAD